MKSKLFLLTVLIASLFLACNQSKQNKEAEPEVKTEKVKPTEKPKPLIAKGILLNAENDEPIGMAMVTVAGTTIGTLTNSEGKFHIEAPAGAKQLLFGANGFEAQKVDIDAENEMTVKLKPKAQ